MKKYNKLYTDEYDKMNQDLPLSEYPFPQLIRNSYISLNGKWNYKICTNDKDFSDINDEILVPFPLESTASGVGKRLNKNEYIIYKREFKLDSSFIKDITYINFLGVDQKFKIYLNGDEYKEFIPLNLPTKIDISKSIKEFNELIVVVKDDLDYRIPLGKQSNKPKGIFYTPFSGIYFPVYLESFNNNFIKDIDIKTDLDNLYLNIDSSSEEFNILIYDNETLIKDITTKDKNITINIENPKHWDCENPHLYDLIIKTSCDKIKSYFALRTISLENGYVCLNGKRVFLNGVLDQGYYPEGIITPSTYKSLENDVLQMKELGFNTLRKHIKVELPYFYYLCDKHGMLVIQDFVNNGKYNFLIQTALPTIGFQKKNDKSMNKDSLQRENFIKAGEMLIEYLKNHPSILLYTIFNEGWGQFDSEMVYNHFKSLYPNLIFDTASGWFRGAKTDLDSYHWYFKNIDKLKDVDHPVFISEFGAYCYKLKNHAYGDDNVFGYKYFSSLEEVENAFIKLYEDKIIPYKDKLIGTIYTQLSDVEEEDNGLLSYDRKILKLNKDIVKNVLKKLK